MINRLKEYKLKNGFTFIELSKKLGVSESTVKKWFSGVKSPRASTVKLIEMVIKGETR